LTHPDLFAPPLQKQEEIALEDGATLRIERGFIDAVEGNALLRKFTETLPWEISKVKVFGKTHPIPRLNAWLGAPGAVMTYSKTRFDPHPFTTEIEDLRQRLVAECGTSFNSVLCNLYRDGHDKMGYHSDDERELGDAPLIASLSFGATRKFVLKHKSREVPRIEIPLSHGDLLIMGGQCQRFYKHALPKSVRVKNPRINLTFRQISLSS